MNYLFLVFFFSSLLFGQSLSKLDKVTLHLQWLDQFQFAGYYVAKEKGFYKEFGLDVDIKKFTITQNIVDEVENNPGTYGIGRSSLIIDRSKKKKIKLISAIFQSSPLVIIATKKSNIKTIKDFKNKRIMVTNDASSVVSLYAIQNKFNISHDSVIYQQHSFNIDDLINAKTDLMASYISNEPYLLKQRGIEINIFNPKEYGFDFYSDLLFTSEKETQFHKERVVRFRDASLKGWYYAFSHIEESVEIILKHYNSQNRSREALLYEAQELKKLAYSHNAKLGQIELQKIQNIYDIYNVMNFVPNKFDIKEFIFDEREEGFVVYVQNLLQKYHTLIEELVVILFIILLTTLYWTLKLQKEITIREKTEKELEKLNTTLQQRIDVEVAKNQVKDQEMLNQTRLEQIGEMISMIAHQWRQPLSAISSGAISLKLKLEFDKFNLNEKKSQEECKTFFLNKLDDIEKDVLSLSDTIDDFRNFYKPNRVSVEISFAKILKNALRIIDASYNNDKINVQSKCLSDAKVKMYANEMMQVILNILQNAQDNFREKAIKDPQIFITINKREIIICDNGGGIEKDIQEKIFYPYFSTKKEKNGTGLGLYMSKIIVEDHHKGKLTLKNSNNGICFSIKLPTSTEFEK